jgi:hypothetical protein
VVGTAVVGEVESQPHRPILPGEAMDDRVSWRSCGTA